MKKILLIHPEGNINNNPNLTGIVEILCENAHEVKRMLLDMSSKLKSGDTSMGIAILPSVTNSSFELGNSRTNNINQEYFNVVVDISQSLKRIEHLLAAQQQNQSVTSNYQNHFYSFTHVSATVSCLFVELKSFELWSSTIRAKSLTGELRMELEP